MKVIAIVTETVPNILLVVRAIRAVAVRARQVDAVSPVEVELCAIEAVVEPSVAESVANVGFQTCAVGTETVGALERRVGGGCVAVSSVEAKALAFEIKR